MINSMTGFGRLCREVDEASYIAEIKTLNSRYYKANVRLPEALAFLEDDIEKLLRRSIYRGTVHFQLHYKSCTNEPMVDIDTDLIAGFLKKIQSIQPTDAQKVTCSIDLATLLTLPGIIRPATPEVKKEEQIKNTVLEIVKGAIDNLKEMRAEEGKMLFDKTQDFIKDAEQGRSAKSKRKA